MMAPQVQRLCRVAAAHARLLASEVGPLLSSCNTLESPPAIPTTSYSPAPGTSSSSGSSNCSSLCQPAHFSQRPTRSWASSPCTARVHQAPQPGVSHARWLSSSVGSHASSTEPTGPPTGSPGDATADSSAAPAAGAPPVLTLTLAEALGRLVDTAVDLVGNNSLPEAINVLKEGITTLEPKFPASAEIGELYNQVALLLYFQNSCDEAVEYAQISLDITRDKFGPASRLTAHRMLRLATCKYGQGRMPDASKLLEESLAVLGEDPAHLEGAFYQHLIHLSSVHDDAVEAARMTDVLLAVLRGMKAADGGSVGDNMVVTLMLAQHNQLLNAALERPVGGRVALAEALFKQHIALLEEVQADSEDLGITHYKLATFYYANDMPADGGASIKRASAIMRMHYPEDHDLMILCRHRMGMLCTASGDHRSALQLLALSLARYSTKPETKGLAVEAEVGIAYARCQAASTADARNAALADMKRLVADLAANVGSTHMLVVAAQGHLVKAIAEVAAQARP